MRGRIIRALLSILNSRWLNQSPCKYEYVGNVDAFSREDIECTLRQDPTMTLQEYIDSANRFKTCPMRKDGGVTVIEGDECRDANIWDMHDLRNLGGK